ncbi:NAD(P)-dependent oxidoreductase [Brevibacillus sp. 7WMA2]|uniref:NAD(P)-dependent oxidoreductase n=1 Tax=Brevibacillus TaxID=55080 RepID=UPI0007C98E79|nr:MULTISPECIES: NAD(P)-dependent oxidoreductase [Brevibacillus]WPS89192.1 NAD(P)-dependent oxidoreductase [Brevibacillus halotolerans]MCR8996962.1 NAD(P)-dependent oxidoreductase [Brevibacillus laterosporus]MDF9412805.1 NAD(P)-dependent oxidoreductase [Brevibacillus laterosporus]MDN9010865.1 NAD(P)-dependent oxidoreductase [Brevibacillus laterosporus]MDO0941888.1 NAD(P)-dependent oxidoreductase [Brevibacillus laterosporus]
MKIAIIGATGRAGKLIMQEALQRGHEVTAIVRDASKLDQNQKVAVLQKDIFDLTTQDLNKFDVVVNSFGAKPGEEHLHVEAGNVLIEALKNAPQTKLFVVGGAGSLFVDEAKTVRLFETPEFPKEYLATATNQGKNLEILKQSNLPQWTFLSPSAMFEPGERTGRYQKGEDNLLVNAKGESSISMEDYAIAVLDELENPQFVNKRFTVASV